MLVVVFGAGGSIGAAAAKEFAAEGAQVFLVGRTKSNLELVANQIAEAGGTAQTDVLDTLDDAAVNRYTERICNQGGKIDIVPAQVAGLADPQAMPVDNDGRSTSRAARADWLSGRSEAYPFPARSNVLGPDRQHSAFDPLSGLFALRHFQPT